jgi:UPF0176 protein
MAAWPHQSAKRASKTVYHIAAFYCFTPIDNREETQAVLMATCTDLAVRGTILVASEGLNGTVAGSTDAIDRLVAHIRELPGCADIDPKYADAQDAPFLRMKVRLKNEIVAMGEPDVDPISQVGTYVDPEDWNQLISEPDTIIIDTRNDYEVATGSFANAINPQTESFREFPDWFRNHRETLLKAGKDTKVAMFCTGGIRCEKATALLRSEGVDQVFLLKGGILKYLETVPEPESLWDGECFVFDERVTVTHGLIPGNYGLCRACRRPISAADQASELFEDGISCPHCHDRRTNEQREGYAERQRQAELARARGQAHIGAVFPRDG